MTDQGATKCRSCDTLIVMRTHERTGKTAPIDAYPSDDPKANVQLLPGYQYRLLKDGDPVPEDGRYFNHFLTCPDAARFRSKPRKQAALPG